MKTATPIQLTCPECRRDNEPERIYCHDCGARLDRSALAGRKTGKIETSEELHKRMRGMFSQRRIKAQLFFSERQVDPHCDRRRGGSLVMLIAPEVPPAVKSEEFPPQINLSLETLTESRQPQTMQFSGRRCQRLPGQRAEAQKGKAGIIHYINLERALVAFSEGNCRVTIERSIFGYSIFTSGDYAVQIEGGKVKTSPRSGPLEGCRLILTLCHTLGFYSAMSWQQWIANISFLNKVGSIQLHEKRSQLLSAQ